MKMIDLDGYTSIEGATLLIVKTYEQNMIKFPIDTHSFTIQIVNATGDKLNTTLTMALVNALVGNKNG